MQHPRDDRTLSNQNILKRLKEKYQPGNTADSAAF